MCFPFLGLLLEHILTLWTEDVVPKAEILVKHHGSFRNPLVAILALLFLRTMHFCVVVERHWILLGATLLLLGIERKREIVRP